MVVHLRKTQAEPKAEKEAKKPVIKKPLNAFMLYMKEMRAKVIAECTLKESAAINQILGRRVRPLASGLRDCPHTFSPQLSHFLMHPICPLPCCSGMHYLEKSRPSTMNWPARKGSCTCSYTRAGPRGITT
jgi:hypothetical protein